VPHPLGAVASIARGRPAAPVKTKGARASVLGDEHGQAQEDGGEAVQDTFLHVV